MCSLNSVNLRKSLDPCDLPKHNPHLLCDKPEQTLTFQNSFDHNFP